MGKTIQALLKVQSIERDLAHVKRRLRKQQRAVTAQQKKIDQLNEHKDAVQGRLMARRQDADRLDVDLKQKDEHVSKLRGALNSAKTNKEYASILTEINTFKADNARLEEEALRAMQEIDAIKAETEQVQRQIEVEQQTLDEIQQNSASEIDRLNKMLADLQSRRDAAAAEVPDEAMAAFDRISDRHEGEAMAPVEQHGKKPPYDYICGGCFMTLNAEHANALQTRDEVRTCDNCGRLLYLEQQAQSAGNSA